MKRLFLTMCLVLLVCLAGTSSAAIVDSVSDLDLTNVVKAVHWGNSDGAGGAGTALGLTTVDQTIGTTTFLVSGGHNITANGVTTAGMAYSGDHDGWTGARPIIGGTADDDALEDILNGVVWLGDPPASITMPITNGTYKVQLLLYDGFLTDSRPMDIAFEGVTIATQYDQDIEQTSLDVGTMLTAISTVVDGQLDIDFTNGTANGIMISGLIVNQVPEPATLMILGMGGLALLRKRK